MLSPIAHIAQHNEGFLLQSLQEHLENTARLAAQKVGAWGEEWSCLAEVIGLLHDVGKYQNDFQNYIACASGYNSAKTTQRAPHSAAGAAFASKLFPQESLPFHLLAHTIAGHHRGLYNQKKLYNVLNDVETKQQLIESERGIKQSNSHWLLERLKTIDTKKLLEKEVDAADTQMLLRMLFSALVDADFLDTENFMQPERAELRQQLQVEKVALWHTLQQRLQAYTDKFKADTPVNKARASFLQQCRTHGASAEKSFYSLTLPTGAGKTLTSMAWALETAKKHQASRIIYIIPYTSIITQTAAQFRKIFGEDYILEHHSDIEFTEEDQHKRHKVLSENWDIPIVVTTSVQFFESLFANKPSRCRKVHNIANAVLVFDEVQKLPPAFLNPILRSIESLCFCFGTQTLFCTATQPVFDEDISNHVVKSIGRELYFLNEKITEIIPYDKELYQHFRRVDYHLSPIETDIVGLAKQLFSHGSLLCVVNTRPEAITLYNAVIELGGKEEEWYHLSRNMCSAHIQDTINTIKDRLSKGYVTKVISTPLIEAGVDLDFPVVYRAKAGLDSIIQTAGRCNREGRLPQRGQAYVFNLKGTKLPKGDIGVAQTATCDILYNNSDIDPELPKHIKEFYINYYNRQTTFDKGNICPLLWGFSELDNLHFDFEEAAESFRLIDNKDEREIIVPYFDDTLTLFEREHFITKHELRKLQRQTVRLHQHNFEKLAQSGRVEVFYPFGEESKPFFVLTDKVSYDAKKGVLLENHFLEEALLA